MIFLWLVFFLGSCIASPGIDPGPIVPASVPAGLFFFFIPPPIKHERVNRLTSWKHLGAKASRFINTSSAAAYGREIKTVLRMARIETAVSKCKRRLNAFSCELIEQIK